MKGFGKRLLALTLCGLMVCLQVVTVFAVPVENCPGKCTHLAAIGTTHYDTLEEAIGAAPEGSTVKLLADVTGQTALFIKKSIVLDLGGKTLSGSNQDKEGLLNVSADFTIQNGTLTANAGTCLLVEDCNLTIAKTAKIQGTDGAAALILSTTSPVVIQTDEAKQTKAGQWINAKISGQLSNQGSYPAVAIGSSGQLHIDATFDKNASVTSADSNAILMSGPVKLTVTGGTFRAKDHAVVLDIPEGATMEASVTGGTFTSGKETFLIQKAEGATAPEDFVTGGTYNQDPTAYIPDFCRVIRNSDSTYTVLSSYTLTFQANGGSGTMAPVTVSCGKSVKLPKCGFTPASGMDFAGWEIGGKTYKAGASFTPEADVTVKALWKAHVHSGGKATCLKKAVCSTCGKSYGSRGSHTLVYVDAYDATCAEAGMDAHSRCSVCGDCFVNGVSVSASSLASPALGHSWESVDGIPATCTEDGLKAHDKCANCGTLRLEGETTEEAALLIPAAGHTMEEVAASQATCSDPGMQAHERCAACDQLFLNGESVDAAQLTTATSSHVLSDWVSDEHYHWKTCVDCQEVFRQGSHADKNADGSCDDCGYAIAGSSEEANAKEGSGFSFLFLIPIVAAVGIAVPLAVKKRK